jgi:hypothetical protein
MSITYLDYTIHLTDKDQVTTLQAARPQIHLGRNENPGQWKNATGLLALLLGARTVGDVYGGPAYAAIKYSAPILTTKDEVDSPCITSPWIVAHDQLTNPVTVDQFDQPHGGFWGFLGDFFSPKTFVWRGSFAYTPVAVAVVDNPSGGGTVPVEPIAQRCWIEGFEHPEQGEGGTGGAIALNFTRAASRHVDGMGLAIRSSDGVKTHTRAQYGAAANKASWERLYVRPVGFPSAATTFWRTKSSTGVQGIGMALNATGRIQVNDFDNSSVQTLIATTNPLVAGRWHKLDMLFEYGASAKFELWINGVQAVTVTSFGAGGLATVANHLSSEVGSTGQSANNLGLDLDDWFCAERPTSDPTTHIPIKTGNDFRNGSRMVRITPSAFASDMANWVGDWRTGGQMPAEDAGASITSSTSGARLSVLTNADTVISGEEGSIGAVAMVVGKYGTRGGTADGTLGYSLGTAETLAAIVEDTSRIWNSMMYRPAGMSTPTPIIPVTLIHEKGASVNLATVDTLAAVVELIGVFGQEDVAPSTAGATPAPTKSGTGLHNAPYPRSPWARAGLPPLSPVVITAGTYTGNGVGQDLVFRTPIHWLFIRRATTNADGTFWFSSNIAAHHGVEEAFDPAGMVDALIDPTYDVPVTGTSDAGTQTLVRITGAEAQVNTNAVVYQYVAISDPGMRFMLNGVLSWPNGSADRLTTLINTNFLPEVAFFSRETMNGGSGAETYFKGIGHDTLKLSKLTAAETASAVAFNRGSLQSKSALHFAGVGQAIAFSLFRRDDGITDSGKVKVLQLASYVGNATNPRTIALTPASGVRPLFALVVPHDAASVYRDPSHTGTTSTTLNASNNASNGIRGGGIDQLIVGSDLNANGVTYDVFVIPGSVNALNNGFSDNGEFAPVDPATPVDGPFEQEPTGDPTILTLPDDGTVGGVIGVPGGDDFGTQCVTASTRVINIGLSHIGVTALIGDIVNDVTNEAIQARLHYGDDVEATLREWPWPFATGYATLELLDGTPEAPVNDDWIYSYQLPDDFVFGRRLVRAGTGRKYDPSPAAWRIGTDLTTGATILYSNEVDAVLEYTFRPSCAAGRGDSLFRTALGWKVAHSLAPGLARNKVTAADAYAMFRQTIAFAKQSAANEAQPEPGTDADWINARN